MEKKTPLRGYEAFVIVMMFLTYGLFFMDRFAVSILATYIMPDLGMNYTQLGLAVSVLGFAYAISCIVTGILGDVLSARKRILVIAVIVFSVASVGSGLATTFGFLLVCRLIMGFAEGPVPALALGIVNMEAHPTRRGFASGFVQSASCLMGAAVAGAVLIFLATHWGWRAAFMVLFIPGIIFATILGVRLKEPSMEAAGLAKPTLKTYISALKTRNIWVCLIMATGMMGWWLTTMAYATPFLSTVNGFSPAQSAAFLVAFGLAIFVSDWFMPMLSDRFGRKPIALISSFFCVLSTIVVLNVHTFLPLMVLIIITMIFGAGYSTLCAATVPAESVPRESTSSVIGFVVFAGEMIAALIITPLAGFMADKYGISAAIVFTTGCAVLAFISAFFLKETAPRKLAQIEAQKAS